MSGTSLDGVDAVIVDFSISPPNILFSSTFAFDQALRQELSQLVRNQTTTLDQLYHLDARLADLYVHAVSQAIETSKINREEIKAIGCHGQTIRHRPDAPIAYTAQLGDPNRVAALSRLTTVADFRRKDMAFGGQGAPLASAYHRFLFHSAEENRVLLNIGGIANITSLPANSSEPISGFDTGPGNTLLDYWTKRQKNEDFDHEGEWARQGRVNADLLQEMLTREPYFSAKPPKSTGTEYFNSDWLEQFQPERYAINDVQATLLELTVNSIAEAVTNLEPSIQSLFVCGGGASNLFMLERLRAKLCNLKLSTTQSLGVDPNYVEACAFAWLARERLHHRPGNLTEVTNASQPCVLGGMYDPN